MPGHGPNAGGKLAWRRSRVKNFCEGYFGSEAGIKSIEGTAAHRVAGAKRDFDSVRSGCAQAAGWRDEVVLRCCGRSRGAAGWRLLAHGRCCGGYETGADAGDWVGAVQAGNGGEDFGGAGEFFGDESEVACGCGERYSIAERNCGKECSGRAADSENASGI